jgi:hypothetical protein
VEKMNRFIVFLFCLVFVSFGLSISQCYATTYTGSLQYNPSSVDSSDGLNVQSSGENWPTYTVNISWSVTNEDTTYSSYPWKYTYTFGLSGNQSGLSHLILETSSNFTASDITGLTGASVGSTSGIGSQRVQSGNTGMPEDVYGIRFDPLTTSPSSITVTFWSTRAPVWGDFYAKDGRTNYAYNYNNTNGVEKGFTTSDVDPTAAPSNDSVDYHILRPDTVPEPAAIGLILLGSWLLSKKRRA